MKELNNKYRNINKTTDVLSFALKDDETFVSPLEFEVLGDVYISLDRSRSDALDEEITLEHKILILIAHGVLHLLGYDHYNKSLEKIMFSKQEELVKEYEDSIL